MKSITSSSNPQVKRVIALRTRRDRDRDQLMVVEGAAEVRRALAAGVRFESLYWCESLVPEPPDSDATLYQVSRSVLEKMSYRKTPDGILGIARQPKRELTDLSVGADGLFVVAVGLEKPGNLGAILRTADAVGAAGLIVCDRCTDLWNPNTIRASLGTVFIVPGVEATSSDARAWLKEHQVRLVAASPEGAMLYTEADFTGLVALVLGEEHAGLGADWLAAADASVRLPMHGAADSLNVSTTAAVLLYEAIRQRS